MEDYAGLYTELHKNEKHFSGRSLGAHVERVAELVRRTEPRSLLDYGSGKGYQYLAQRMHERWGGLLPFCYDVGVRQLAARPTGTFGGVICTDVMEHIAPKDVDAILADVIGFAEKFVYFGISCRPAARKTLPDGRNVHLTVESPSWWDARIKRLAPSQIIVETAYD